MPWYNNNWMTDQEYFEATGNWPAESTANGGWNPNPTEQLFQTREGPRTIAQIRAEMQAAGYNGPWDAASLIAAYNAIGTQAASQGATMSDLLDALLGSNRERFAWEQETWQKEFEQRQKEYYGNLAASLLGTASQLTGPQDWLKYQEYMSGGRNLFQDLYGDQPLPLFTGASGTSNPRSLYDMLIALGLAPAQAAAVAGQEQGAPTAAEPGEEPAASVPAGYQMNPIVWDSLSPTAKQMVFGALQAGKTSSGYQDPNDWLAQLNASRPQGQAPRRTSMSWAPPRGVFG